VRAAGAVSCQPPDIKESIMQVQMNRIYAGPHGNCGVNGIIDLPDDVAAQIVEEGYGRAIKLVEITADVTPIETADARPIVNAQRIVQKRVK